MAGCLGRRLSWDEAGSHTAAAAPSAADVLSLDLRWGDDEEKEEEEEEVFRCCCCCRRRGGVFGRSNVDAWNFPPETFDDAKAGSAAVKREHRNSITDNATATTVRSHLCTRRIRGAAGTTVAVTVAPREGADVPKRACLFMAILQ